jgi:hypothetical protein
MTPTPALELARLSELVYGSWPDIETRLRATGFQLIAKFDRNDTEGMLVSNRKWAGLVFRGTEATNFHVRDIFSNVGALVRWAGKGRVHSGYERHLNMVRHSARELVEDVADDLPVFVTGHSLGGAVVTQFASWWYGDRVLAERGYKLAGLVTFGAPKSVNREAANAIGCPIKRFVMRGDWAPRHPLSFSLVHPVKATLLKPVKWWPPTPLSRHGVSRYVAALERAVRLGGDRAWRT